MWPLPETATGIQRNSPVNALPNTWYALRDTTSLLVRSQGSSRFFIPHKRPNSTASHGAPHEKRENIRVIPACFPRLALAAASAWPSREAYQRTCSVRHQNKTKYKKNKVSKKNTNTQTCNREKGCFFDCRPCWRFRLSCVHREEIVGESRDHDLSDLPTDR